MKPYYQILEHTADLKVKFFGETKEDLFKNVMLGMFEIAQYCAAKTGKEFRIKIVINSVDLESLLVDFLNEILYLVEAKKLVFEKIEFKKFTENKIEATLKGKKLKKMGLCIKGVTYHDLSIRKNKKWQAIVLFDV